MTAPADGSSSGQGQGNSGQGQGNTGKGKDTQPAPAAPAVLDVVSFTRTNPVTRGEHRGIGVVVAVDDDGLDVAPVSTGHRIRLAADQVTVVTDDATGEV